MAQGIGMHPHIGKEQVLVALTGTGRGVVTGLVVDGQQVHLQLPQM